MALLDNEVSLLNVKQQTPSEIRHHQTNFTEAGTITQRSGTVRLEGAAASFALTFGYDSLMPGDELLIVNVSGSYSVPITTPSGVTWDGTNDTATFGTGGDALLVRAISDTRFFIIANIGSVSLS